MPKQKTHKGMKKRFTVTATGKAKHRKANRGHRLGNRIDTSMMWPNSHNVRDLRTPFGGVKESGLGREGGEHSLDFFTDTTIVHVALGDTHVPRFGLQA